MAACQISCRIYAEHMRKIGLISPCKSDNCRVSNLLSYLRGAYEEHTGISVPHNWEWAPRTALIILDWGVTYSSNPPLTLFPHNRRWSWRAPGWWWKVRVLLRLITADTSLSKNLIVWGSQYFIIEESDSLRTAVIEEYNCLVT